MARPMTNKDEKNTMVGCLTILGVISSSIGVGFLFGAGWGFLLFAVWCLLLFLLIAKNRYYVIK